MKYNKLEQRGIESFLKDITKKGISYGDISDNSYNFKVVASSDNIDRNWERFDINGWDFVNFLKNPIIVADHLYTIENIVWKATALYIEGWKVIVEWVFADTEKGKLARELYNGWFLKTVSPWISPKEYDRFIPWLCLRQELLELSFVVIPWNADAMSIKKSLKVENKENALGKESTIIVNRLDLISKNVNNLNENFKKFEIVKKTLQKEKETRDVNIDEIIEKSIRETFWK